MLLLLLLKSSGHRHRVKRKVTVGFGGGVGGSGRLVHLSGHGGGRCGTDGGGRGCCGDFHRRRSRRMRLLMLVRVETGQRRATAPRRASQRDGFCLEVRGIVLSTVSMEDAVDSAAAAVVIVVLGPVPVLLVVMMLVAVVLVGESGRYG